jgi:cell division protein ZapA (FtsZ GTPase activity inhibitor)
MMKVSFFDAEVKELRKQLESANTKHIAGQVALNVVNKELDAATNQLAEVNQGFVKCTTALVVLKVSYEVYLAESQRKGS